MSATLRYDIGRALFYHLADELKVFRGKEVERWAGLVRGGRTGMMATFAIKLPGQIGECMQLIDRLTTVIYFEGPIGKSAHNLRNKLVVSIGWPRDRTAVKAVEEAFVSAIQEHPGDLSTWFAYADWLQDTDDVTGAMQKRGRLIAGWLDPHKALKVKYGIPLLDGKPVSW